MPNSDPEKRRRRAPVKKTLIGWTEYVDFVDWGISRVRAKVDTGARTSALHVENLQILRNHQARFQVILSRKLAHRRTWVTAPVVKWARVRSSTGHFALRCFVLTRVRIGPVTKEIAISLVSREDMTFRMLLGRQALEKDFVVDVSRYHVLGGKAHNKEGSKTSP
ncbi:MAG: ATP-dependent zinc protease [Candidatus Hydrogenedentes bacterium]|nr:ATP-dependent zinc protease [Candidatus Hydrogenedentota bacterium]MBI3119102.1 ATP-dependent zinc protease [Candidatus Hydrogenedentota bacterium]